MAGLHATAIEALRIPTGPVDEAIRAKIAARRADDVRRRDEHKEGSVAFMFGQEEVEGGDAALAIVDAVPTGEARARGRIIVARLLRTARGTRRGPGPWRGADVALWNHAQAAYRLLIDREKAAPSGRTLIDELEDKYGPGTIEAWDGSDEVALVGVRRP